MLNNLKEMIGNTINFLGTPIGIFIMILIFIILVESLIIWLLVWIIKNNFKKTNEVSNGTAKN